MDREQKGGVGKRLDPIWKRTMDLVLGGLALVVTLPLCGVIALWIKLTSKGPVLFRQLRPGLVGQPFTLLKFRTMTEGKDGRGNILPDAMRLTRFGRFLRATSLDELPELINVLRGEMSLVGPRPLLMRYLPRYTPEQSRRHEVKPGITGWAQVNGRNAITWEQKFALDVWYVNHSSFWIDCKIMFLTVFKVLSGSGISQPGHATMEEFKG
jgi:sugar transferase EpsL